MKKKEELAEASDVKKPKKEKKEKRTNKALSAIKRNIAMVVFMLGLGACILEWFYVGTGTATLALLYLAGDGTLKSGKQGSTVYMRNGRARTYKSPSLVRNDFTELVRGRLATLSAAWSGLTQEERSAWLNYEFPSSNRWGQAVMLTGKQAYIAANINISKVGYDLISSPAVDPTPLISPIADQGTLVEVDEVLSMVVIDPSTGDDIDSVPIGSALVIYATGEVAPGLEKPNKNKFKQIMTISAGTAIDDSATIWEALYTAYTERMGVPSSEGNKFFIELQMVSGISGRVSGRQRSVGAIDLV